MSNSKHTPGPWLVDYGHVYSDKYGIVADCEFQRKKDEGQSECQANAHLIAAAPEMLEALEHGVAELMKAYKVTTKLEMKDVEGGAFINETVMRLNEVLKSAITKAKGGAK